MVSHALEPHPGAACYIEGTLGIRLSGEVLPMCSTVGYLRPYLLNHRKACYVVRT